MFIKSFLAQLSFLYIVYAYGAEKLRTSDPDEKLNTTVRKK